MNNPLRVFFEIIELQEQAIFFLKEKKILESNDNKIKLLKTNIPNNLYSVLKDDSYRQEDIFNILTKEFSKQNLRGNNWLKMKTNLMEYIYD